MQQHSEGLADGTSRAVRLESFGGPEVLAVQDVPEPQVGDGQIRVRVTAAGLNPMDWFMTADDETAARFGLSLPAGFGTDYAGVVDQVGAGASGYAVGDRVFGAALSRAVADFVVVDADGNIATGVAHHTPDDVDDRTAATLSIAGSTAAAALAVLDLGPHDTVLIGGAGGGVGVFAVQLARIAGARVIGTGSPSSAEHLRSLGAEPVAYGEGLIGRIRDLDAGPVTAALDLYGTDTVHTARQAGSPRRSHLHHRGRRSTASREPTAPTPPPTPWRTSRASSQPAACGYPSQRPSPSKTSARPSNSRRPGMSAARS